MFVLHVSRSDMEGGAAIAAMRLMEAQRAAGFEARALVLYKGSDAPHVHAATSFGIRERVRLARFVAKRIGLITAHSDPYAMRTLALVPSGLGANIERLAPDIVHWHWVGAEAVSLAEMASVRRPAVWTCHDEWAFCGAEHYAPDDRFTDGYEGADRRDVDAMTFRRKQAAWDGWLPTLICPSNWIEQAAARSRLAGPWHKQVIPNTLDFAVFRPRDQEEARSRLGLPEDGNLVLFGGHNGTRDPRKGFDLLEEALRRLPRSEARPTMLVTFGGQPAGSSELLGFPHVSLGEIADPFTLSHAYSAADLFVAPSRADNLPNTMVEAQACGTPCIAFAVGGMGDIVREPHHGVLVEPFDVAKLAQAIEDRLSRSPEALRRRISQDAEARFGSERIANMHNEVYRKLLKRTGRQAAS